MDEGWSLEKQRELAKLAMTLSMAVTVLTGPHVRHNRNMRLAHTVSGVALVASSVWHNSLYSVREKSAEVKRLPPAKSVVYGP